MAAFKEIGHKVLHNDNIFFTFLRSIASSQAASWVDMAVRFVFFAVVGLGSFYSTAIGCVAGGVVNCIINYRFTFHAQGCDPRAVAVKYAMVWAGSLLLNSWGTLALYNIFCRWPLLQELGFKPDGYYMAATLTVSLIVSWAWNFMLQRYFVYRKLCFDRYAAGLIGLFYKGKNSSIQKTQNQSSQK